MIRTAATNDIYSICSIYNHYVQNTIVSFEEQPLSFPEMENRIAEGIKTYPWLVYHKDDRILGYAYASQWRSRPAYRYTVESTIYLDPDMTGRGLGYQLYSALISDLRSRNFHSAVGVIALPNPASIALHEKLGFVKVAHFKEAGWKFDRWIDVGHWQLVL